MIAVQERQLNIKDLQWAEPIAPKRFRPVVDFSAFVTYVSEPSQIFNQIPQLAEQFKKAYDNVKQIMQLTLSNNNTEDTAHVTDWDKFLGSYLGADLPHLQHVGLSMYLFYLSDLARKEKRDVSPDETDKITSILLLLSEKDERKKDAKDLRILAQYPEVLVWLSEVVNFQESTLSIPNYSQAKKIIATNPEMPVRRRF
jgi:hypothetical protein